MQRFFAPNPGAQNDDVLRSGDSDDIVTELAA
jgi:hypothetical protein